MLDGPSGYTLDAGKVWAPLGKVNRGWDLFFWVRIHC